MPFTRSKPGGPIPSPSPLVYCIQGGMAAGIFGRQGTRSNPLCSREKNPFDWNYAGIPGRGRQGPPASGARARPQAGLGAGPFDFGKGPRQGMGCMPIGTWPHPVNKDIRFPWLTVMWEKIRGHFRGNKGWGLARNLPDWGSFPARPLGK